MTRSEPPFWTSDLPRPVQQILGLAQVDFRPRHEQPKLVRVLLATVVAVVGSLVADMILVKLGVLLFPQTKGFVHFRFGDYARLTVVGVVVACIGWPIVTRISSSPRWLFLRLAAIVTLVLWLPDVYIFLKGENGRAVLVLMVMHLAIAVVTYNALVHIAPASPLVRQEGDRPSRAVHTDELEPSQQGFTD